MRSWFVALLIVSGAGCGSVVDVQPDASANKVANGDPCVAGADCGSGHCVDTVCCETACEGTCMTCNGATPGTCSPVAINTDPAMECLGVAAAPDAGSIQVDGGQVNVPDGGVNDVPSACAGSCNGAGACQFPGKEKGCGTSFCNSTDVQLAYECDGAGGCEVQTTDCVAYSCGPDACRSSCSANSDCLSDHYCNGMMCIPRFATGVQCSVGTQCLSGYCEGDTANGVTPKVCCDSACNFTGASCVVANHEGQCECSKTCDNGFSCVITYPDTDGDGFGDSTYTPNPATDVYCNGGTQNAIPAGRTVNNTDCYDHNASAYPGPRQAKDQTCSGLCCNNNYYTTDRGDGSFDYNCDGTIEKLQNEWSFATQCHFCDPSYSTPCSSSDRSCSASGENSTFAACAPVETCSPFIGGTPSPHCGSCNFIFFCGNQVGQNTGFLGTVSCGHTGTLETCGTCPAVNMPPTMTASSVVQSCL